MIINEKLTVHARTVNNRIVFQPMEGCDGTADGTVGELTERRYMRFAENGAGIIWFEATAVCKAGRANPKQLYLTEKNMDTYRHLLQNMRNAALEKFGYAPLIILQMTHSGRYSKPSGTPEPIVAYRNSPNAANSVKDFREICHIEIIILYDIILLENFMLRLKNVKLLVSRFGRICWCSFKIFDKPDTD